MNNATFVIGYNKNCLNFKQLMKWFKAILVLILIIASYFLFWPTPVDPVAWQPSPIPASEGKWASYQQTEQPTVLFRGWCAGCEDVAISAGGMVYGSSADGSIQLFKSMSTTNAETLAVTGGRPLGLHLDKDANLWVCDADQGLLQISPEGGVFRMVTEYEGKDFRFTNDLDIGESGMVYFSVASQKFGIEQYKFDLIEHQPTGRLFSYNPVTKATTLLADGLYFANGVAVDVEENYVLIC